MATPYLSLARICADIALAAAVPILDIYEKHGEARIKSDGSPVTEADLLADEMIRQNLQSSFPDIPVISEESEVAVEQNLNRYFLVDPLDGTREFLSRTGEFTVNIALIENGVAKMGAIFAPCHGQLFIGAEHAYECVNLDVGDKIDSRPLTQIAVRKSDADRLVALGSLSHGEPDTEAFLLEQHPREIRKSGSSLKFCIIAKGEADFYPRFSPTMGWDVAAGHAILRAAGGTLMNENGELLNYAPYNLRNGPFLAVGDPVLGEKLKSQFMNFCQNRYRA